MRNLKIALKKVEDIAKKIGNRKLHHRTVSKILNKELGSLSVKCKFKAEANMAGYLVLSGQYNPPFLNEDHRYSVIISHDPKNIYIKPRRNFYEELICVLAHEFRHGYQDRKRKYRKVPFNLGTFKHKDVTIQEEVRYLSNNEEIDSYAFECVVAKVIGSARYMPTFIRYSQISKHSPNTYKKFITRVKYLSDKHPTRESL